MKTPLIALTLLGIAATAFAQDPAAGDQCHPVAPTSRVVMTMTDGTSVSGTLLCLGEQALMLAADGMVTTRPLADVRRIARPRDGVLDGLLKGAAIGLVFGAILCLECATEYRLQTALGYAVMGVTIDALQSHAKTIYEGAPRPSLGVRIRF